MFVYKKFRSSNVVQCVQHIYQKDSHLFHQRSSIKNELSRTVSLTSDPSANSEISLISNDHIESRALNNNTLQSLLDRYNDKRIIFNSITFKWDKYSLPNRKQVEKRLKAQKLFSSESIIYQRLQNTKGIKCQKQSNDAFHSGESLHQKSDGSESATYQRQDDLPLMTMINKSVKSDGFNIYELEENNCSKVLHPTEVSENDILRSENDFKESIPTFHKTGSQVDRQYTDKFKQELIIGSADKNVPESNVKCSGCGALQHCQDPLLPGFKPYEKFVGLTDAELRLTVCYRCHFLTGFDLAVPTVQSPQSYRALLRPVKSLDSLVLLLVDLTDAPCSIHPDFLQIIARRQPVIVVGSKVDLLPLSGPTCLNRALQALGDLIQRTSLAKANILDTCLVSGHTGYGVEDLVSSIFRNWQQKGKFLGDVFIVGCTNSGKSTLFNALLQSDLSDQLADTCSLRSTTSTWPATTVDMIKFPMLLWTPWHSHQAGFRGDTIPVKKLRFQRLKQEKEKPRDLPRLPPTEQFTLNPITATLTGTVGRTNVMNGPPPSTKSPFSAGSSIRKTMRKMRKVENEEVVSYNPDDKVFDGHTYCYDTPGLVQPHQFLGLLTQEELRLVLPDQLIVPETFRLRPGMSLFVGGLARLDVLHLHHDDTDDAAMPNYVKVTVFRSRALPVSVVWGVAASSFLRDYLGSSLLRVPMGPDSRLQQWPALEPCNITAVGVHWTEADADVVLSSAGWVSLSLPPGKECQLRAWTPGGRGAFLRVPALLPLAGKMCRPIARNSVICKGNSLYVAQPKPLLEEPTESDDYSGTNFPAIEGGRISLGQTSPHLLLGETLDQRIPYSQNEQIDDCNLQTAHKYYTS